MMCGIDHNRESASCGANSGTAYCQRERMQPFVAKKGRLRVSKPAFRGGEPGRLPMAARSLVPMWVVHRLTVEFGAMVCRVFAPGRHGTVVSLAVVEVMIDVAVEICRSVKPWSCPDKHAACKPFGAVIAIRRTVVRRGLVISVRADRGRADLHRNLRRSRTSHREKHSGSNNRSCKVLQTFHFLTSDSWKEPKHDWLCDDRFESATCGSIVFQKRHPFKPAADLSQRTRPERMRQFVMIQ